MTLTARATWIPLLVLRMPVDAALRQLLSGTRQHPPALPTNGCTRLAFSCLCWAATYVCATCLLT